MGALRQDFTFDTFFAHSTIRADKADWQILPEHLDLVGDRAAETAAKFSAHDLARLAGLAHDLGKYSLAFQKRLCGAHERVDHATAGAREIIRAASDRPMSRWLSELAAYAVAGHHAGLADRHGGPASLDHRLAGKDIPELDPIWRQQVDLGSPGRHYPEPHSKERFGFQFAFLGRMIFSELVDADRRDTERHAVESGHEAAKPRDWPLLAEQVDAMIAGLDAHVAGLRRPSSDAGLNALRDRVFQAAKARAGGERGLYTLTVPTGGGKTLAALRFALGHAAAHRAGARRIHRIVVAIPFTGAWIETLPRDDAWPGSSARRRGASRS